MKRAQRLVEPAVVGDAQRLFRPRGEPGFHGRATILGELAVHIAVQLGLGHHLTAFNLAPASLPSSTRSFSRAEESRAITLPTGTPRTRATSSYVSPSVHTSNSTAR